MIADIVCGLAWGDEGKGAVVSQLARSGSYTHAIKPSGGSNSGHTVYVNGVRTSSHVIPSSALYGVRSIVGSGCVLNESKFFAELDKLSKLKSDISNLVKIAHNAHIVTDKHIEEEQNESRIGTTRQGIGGAYRDKAARVGQRAEDVPGLREFCIDLHKELHIDSPNAVILCENSQGISLDVDLAEKYPYCTSTNVGPAAVLNNGIPFSAIRKVFGVAKCYDTYVGSMAFQDRTDPILDKIAEVGMEFGTTTGRRRQVGYLDMDRIIRNAASIGATDIIMKKGDILRKVGVWRLKFNGEDFRFHDETDFRNFVAEKFNNLNVIFSESPDGI